MMRNKSNNRLWKLTAITAFCFMQLAMNSNSFGQCQPYIKIDGVMTIANSITPTGLTLPYWLKEGQTLAADQMVQSISAIEFSVNSNTLEFSQVKKVTTIETVPTGKVWKVESIAKTASLSSSNSAVFSGAGTYSFTVPSCASYICVEAWGSGGGGAGGSSSPNNIGGGGGGGGYGQGCFTVTPGQVLSITIGTAGSQGNTNNNGTNASGPTTITGSPINISVEGGYAGQYVGGVGGAGGSTITGCAVAVAGGNGATKGSGGAAGGSMTSPGGIGGTTGNAATSIINGVSGTIPGGGGGGGAYNSSYGGAFGGSAAPGRVSFTW